MNRAWLTPHPISFHTLQFFELFFKSFFKCIFKCTFQLIFVSQKFKRKWISTIPLLKHRDQFHFPEATTANSLLMYFLWLHLYLFLVIIYFSSLLHVSSERYEELGLLVLPLYKLLFITLILVLKIIHLNFLLMQYLPPSAIWRI